MANMERSRILIISHSYKPLLNPRAFRWASIAEHWARVGATVDVVCLSVSGEPPEEVINKVTVYRTGSSFLEKLRSLFRSNSRATILQSNTNSANIKNPMHTLVSLFIKTPARFIHDLLWKNIYWPDYACLWIGPATKKAIELNSKFHYDAMITVSDPFSSHMVGLELKEINKGLHWLVDIGDPFSFREDTPTNNHRLYRNLNYKVEKSIFEKADKVSVTTHSTKAKYAELFSDSSSKIVVIPPVMNESGSLVNSDRVLSDNNRIKLVYVGTLYRAIRNPKFLLRLFDELGETSLKDNVELHFFGGCDNCKDMFEPFLKSHPKSLYLHGIVERERVMQAMKEADILINIGNDNPYQLPSKVVEYAWLGKPVVNIHRLENDSSKSFLSDYPAILNIHDDDRKNIFNQIDRLRAFIESLPYDVEPKFLESWRERFNVAAIAKMYESCLNKVQQESEPEGVLL